MKLAAKIRVARHPIQPCTIFETEQKLYKELATIILLSNTNKEKIPNYLFVFNYPNYFFHTA